MARLPAVVAHLADEEAAALKSTPLARYLLMAGSFLTVLPFLLLVAYWHPVGTHGWDWAANWGTELAGRNWWEQQAYWYRTTMGRYASTALMSTAAGWYSVPLARLLVLSLHLLLGVAVYTGLRAIFRDLRPRRAATITLVVLALWVSQLSNPYDTLYRYSGLLTYQTGWIATLFFAALLLRRRWGWSLPALVFAVGTNEVSLLHCGLLVAGAGLWHYPRPPARGWYAVATVGLIAAALEIAAPGNWLRAELIDSAQKSLSNGILLTAATSGFQWLIWCFTTPLLLLPWLLGWKLPFPELTDFQVRIVGLGLFLLVPVSLFPVLYFSGGNSLPEGITDLLIIPVSLLVFLLAGRWMRHRPSITVTLVAVVLTLGLFLFRGLSIDRGRDRVYATPFERIRVDAPPGRAWQQLLNGNAARYDRKVELQYATVRACSADTCRIPPFSADEMTFLYDPTYDRRDTGEPHLGYLLGKPGMVVKYGE